MNIVDEKHDRKDKDKVRFAEIGDGKACIHQSRVLIKLHPVHYRLEYDNSAGTHILVKVNAVRLGHVDDHEESRKIAGKTSVISDDTLVKPVSDVAAIFLQG